MPNTSSSCRTGQPQYQRKLGDGAKASRQRGGIDLRLLTTAMAHARMNGTRRSFLGATPAGYSLYEKLGFETACTARVLMSGETHQA